MAHGPDPGALEGVEVRLLAQGGGDHMRALRRELLRRGVESELVSPPGGCGSG